MNGDPTLIAPAMAEVMEAILAIQECPEDGFSRDNAIELVVDELTPEMADVVRRIAVSTAMNDSATSRVTFSEWLGSLRVRNSQPDARPLMELMDSGDGWNRAARTLSELRENIRGRSDLDEVLTLMWECYRVSVVDVLADITATSGEEYATRIVWPDGQTEIHPMSRSEAISAQLRQRPCVRRCVITGPWGRRETAEVVRRCVITGPWHTL